MVQKGLGYLMYKSHEDSGLRISSVYEEQHGHLAQYISKLRLSDSVGLFKMKKQGELDHIANLKSFSEAA